ncbi:hypothetical protein DPMN_075325 [Dreissena polymorpha]|uniref:Uncharacterized protein n=1 Tax=Dreissena polymorpha TaxID=45954 RepID=A0A9D3YGU5_DREPO|nr:hypothetical protein DPMN_075325 [Dreissena polymorpha]
MLNRYNERTTPQVSCAEDNGIVSVVLVAVIDEDEWEEFMESGDGVMDVQIEVSIRTR